MRAHPLRILLLDNFDSFTYNIVQLLERIGVEVIVSQVFQEGATHIILGPGPGSPNSYNIQIVKEYGGGLPILGICLGHQTIASAFGGNVVRAKEPRHGKQELISHDGKGLFYGVSNPLTVTRYHSLVVDSLPSCLEVSSRTKEGEIMGLRHKELPIEGVQFHPESVGSQEGELLFRNFIDGSFRRGRSFALQGWQAAPL